MKAAQQLALAALLALVFPAAAVRGEGNGTARHALPSPEKILRVATSGDYAPFSFVAAPAGAVVADAPSSAAGSAPAPSFPLAPPSPTPSSPPSVPSSPDALAQPRPAETLEGFDIEVATLFARERGYRAEFVRFRWPDLGRELAAGRFDVAMSGVTLKPERSIAGHFTVPVAETHAVALTWKGSGADTMPELDLAVRRIAVNAGGHLESVARQAFRRADVIAIADNDAVRMALLDRAFDAVVTDNFEQKIWTAGMRDVVEIGPLSDDRKAYLLPADRGALAAELDRWLLAREKDGTLARLRARYFSGVSGAATAGVDAVATAEPVAALATAIAERLALMPMVYEAKRRDGKPIEDMEQEAAVLDGAVRALAEAATAAGVAPIAADVARPVFEALIAMGKDVQQALADSDARRRRGVVRHRQQAGAGEQRAGDEQQAGDGESETSDVMAAAAEPELPPARVPSSSPVHDLAAELRPAIARVTGKIARILVAMDEPVGVEQAHRVLGRSLVPLEVSAARIDALAAAVSACSSRRPQP